MILYLFIYHVFILKNSIVFNIVNAEHVLIRFDCKMTVYDRLMSGYCETNTFNFPVRVIVRALVNRKRNCIEGQHGLVDADARR